ncbi:MAG TPA: glycosyltransferase family 1 protein [Candidatus Eisenbacteria bacterium]|jgi:glycosyltransferase involved in cell wall biosynthesis
MTRPVLYTGDIFRLQARGGISRYFVEVIRRLERPARVLAGLHQSAMLGALGSRVTRALYLPGGRGSARLRALVNRGVDAALPAAGGGILHPTYYRDPERLPLRAPVVATVHDMAHERLPQHFRRPWWKARDPAGWKAALCARADLIVCVSESTRRDLVELLDVPASKTRVIHHGSLDWSGIRAAPIAGLERPFLLWVGERQGYKNFERTLRAWAGSRAAAGTALLCAGGGALGGAERDSIARAGAAGRVLQRDCGDAELRWAYEHAAGLLYTSLCEGFGLPILEAMALGCPVVAAQASSLPEVGGEAALYVDPTDEAAIAAGIERCLSEGRAAPRAALLAAQAARFTWEAAAAAHERLYRELD